MTEAQCKAALCKVLRAELPGGVVFRHEDAWTGGIPDISISNNGLTVWVEVKLDRPGRPGKLTALQNYNLTKLQGVLLHYQVDKDGLLGAMIDDFGMIGLSLPLYGTWSTPKIKNKAEVHRIVAAELLRILEEGP